MLASDTMNLTSDQLQRYARQLALPEVDEAGQRKLLAGRVLVIGAGGLGSPAALYLAAAGVGTLGIVDGDALELSNLQRQVLHGTPDIGRQKVVSAADRLRALNPDVVVCPYPVRLTAANAAEILRDYDFVLDATDNFAAKFLIADACHFTHKPYVHAGIRRFQGQCLTVLPGETTCYRCVFEQPPVPDPSDARPAGPFGIVPGVIGTIEAAEALKYLMGIGVLLTNRLLTFDALAMAFRTATVKRNPYCPLCGSAPSVRSPGA